MKYVYITLIVLMAASVDANNSLTDQQISAERSVLNDLLNEDHITRFDYNQRIAMLDHLELSQKINNSKESQVKLGPGGTASISGTVQAEGINQSDVTLALYRPVPGGSEVVGYGMSGSAGEFTIDDLAAGDYFLVIQARDDDFINAIWSATGTEACVNCQQDPANSNNIITLTDAETRIGVDMNLTVGATISGNVTASGSPVINISVLIREAGSQDFHGFGTTDTNGNYTAKGLPAGDYNAYIQDFGDDYVDAIWSTSGTEVCINCQPDADNTISLMTAENRLGVDFSLTVGATLTGQIIDATTLAAVETFQVVLYDTNQAYPFEFYTQYDGSGNYTISGIPASTYKVYLRSSFTVSNEYVPEIYNNIPCNLCYNMASDGAGDDVILAGGVTTNGIDFALEKGASISGAMLNAVHLPETMEELVSVFLFNASNQFITATRLNGTNYDPAFNGTYRVGGLLPGTYFVQGGDSGREFFQRELYDDTHCPWSGCNRGGGGTPVTLGANEQRIGVNFLLEYGGKISGTVTDAATGLPINSDRAQYVQFYDSTGEVAGGAFTQADGTYISSRALPPGTYSVRTGSMFNGILSPPYVMEKYDPAGNIDCPGVTCDLTAGNVLVPAYVRQIPRDPVAEATAATISGIDFALSPAFSFSGTITELSSTNPISDVHVLVYDDSGDFANWATTDGLGDFTVSGLPAGTYYALTNNGSNLPFPGRGVTATGAWIDILFDGTPCPGSACDVTTGDPIVLGGSPMIDGIGGEPVVLDFSLSAGGSITGQVKIFGSDLPAQYVNVNVFNSAGEFYGSYQSDDSGYYLTAGLPDDTYYLTTSNEGALVDVKLGGDYCINGDCDPLDAVPVVITGAHSLMGLDFELRTDYLFKNGLD